MHAPLVTVEVPLAVSPLDNAEGPAPPLEASEPQVTPMDNAEVSHDTLEATVSQAQPQTHPQPHAATTANTKKQLSVTKMLSIGLALKQNQRWRDALKIYDRALDDLGIQDVQSPLFSSLGLEEIVGRDGESTEKSTESFKTRGIIAEVYIMRSGCQIQLNEKQAAWESATNAIKFTPGWYKGYFQLHNVYKVMGNHCGAMVVLSMSQKLGVCERDSISLKRSSHEIKELLRNAEREEIFHRHMNGKDFLDDDVSKESMLELQAKAKTLSLQKNRDCATETKAAMAQHRWQQQQQQQHQLDFSGSEYDDIAAFIERPSGVVQTPKTSKSSKKPRALATAQMTKSAVSSSSFVQASSPLISGASKRLALDASPFSSSKDSYNLQVCAAEERTADACSQYIIVSSATPCQQPSKRIETAVSSASTVASNSIGASTSTPVPTIKPAPAPSDEKLAKIHGSVELFFIKNDANWKRYVEYTEQHGAEEAYQWALTIPEIAAVLTRFQRILATEGVRINFTKAIIKIKSSSPSIIKPLSPSISNPASPSRFESSASPIVTRVRKSWVDMNEDATDSDEEWD